MANKQDVGSAFFFLEGFCFFCRIYRVRIGGACMYIAYMRIQNYQIFEDIELWFQKNINYIVGENSIGKSSFLALMGKLTDGRRFEESDFRDVTQPIRIVLEMQLGDDGGKGLCLEREFMVDGWYRLVVEQRVDEVMPHVYALDTGQEMPLSVLRSVRYISYTAMKPEEYAISSRIYHRLEERLRKWKEEGTDQVDAVAQEMLAYYQHHGQFDLSYYENMNHLFHIMPATNKGVMDNIQVIANVVLKVLVQLYSMYMSKSVPFEKVLVCGKDGKRYLPLVVSIDEPEVHAHPYLQRSVLQYYKRILGNEEPEFCALLKRLFHIDGLQGQMFIVTHSTDALVDDYRHIVRLYRDRTNRVRSACGAKLVFPEELEKHLVMHFPEVKEAFYARSVLIVEGESEYGCFRYLGNALGFSFDYLGICLINARGESSIGRIKKLLEAFSIPTVALYDGDVREVRKGNEVFYTEFLCFEMDVVETLVRKNKRKVLDEVFALAYGGVPKTNTEMMEKAVRKLGLHQRRYPPRRLQGISDRRIEDLVLYYFAWMYGNKGIVLGRALGRYLKAEDIPLSFERVIARAAVLANMGCCE